MVNSQSAEISTIISMATLRQSASGLPVVNLIRLFSFSRVIETSSLKAQTALQISLGWIKSNLPEKTRCSSCGHVRQNLQDIWHPGTSAPFKFEFENEPKLQSLWDGRAVSNDSFVSCSELARTLQLRESSVSHSSKSTATSRSTF